MPSSIWLLLLLVEAPSITFVGSTLPGKLDQLAGLWLRIDKPSQGEKWWSTGPTSMSGFGFRIDQHNGDTVIFEKLSITIRSDAVYYVADVSSNPAPVRFKLTLSTRSRFVFENPDHDFPKRIAYDIRRNHMTTRVDEGEGSDGFTWTFTKARLPRSS